MRDLGHKTVSNGLGWRQREGLGHQTRVYRQLVAARPQVDVVFVVITVRNRDTNPPSVPPLPQTPSPWPPSSGPRTRPQVFVS